MAAWAVAPEARPLGHPAPDDDGRRAGRPRSVIVGYFQDGPDLVTLAMNGWADPEPAWWLSLQAQPEATVDLGGAARAVRAALPRERSGRAGGPGGA